MNAARAATRIPCPYVYARGKTCTGEIVGVEAFKANLAWRQRDDGVWSFSLGEPKSLYHLFCSEKGNHAGNVKSDSGQMKFYYMHLPKPLQTIVNSGR